MIVCMVLIRGKKCLRDSGGGAQMPPGGGVGLNCALWRSRLWGVLKYIPREQCGRF